jgi:ribosome-associated heat shock protein Hsp15
MRIDQLLNKLCLVKTRSIAKNACDKHLVKINNKIVKASAKVFSDDTIEYTLYGYKNVIKILEVPMGNVPKNKAPQYYEIVKREKIEAK